MKAARFRVRVGATLRDGTEEITIRTDQGRAADEKRGRPGRVWGGHESPPKVITLGVPSTVMAKETLVRLTDDIDGSDAVESITFAIRGTEYEIDLNAKNAAALDKALDKFVGAGRKTAAINRNGRTPRRKRPATSRSAAEVRNWARENGYELSDRGRIPTEISEAFDAADQ